MIAVWILLAYLLVQVLYVLAMEGVRFTDRGIPTPETLRFGPTSGERAIILVHGFADGPMAWKRHAAFFAAQGWGVEVPHLSHEATEKEWLETLRDCLTRCRANFRHVELWGHSMGGALSVMAASEVPPDRLVLYAPFFAPWLGRRNAAVLYVLHRVLFRYPFTLTFFPSDRHGKEPEPTEYAIRRVIPLRTFAAMLRVQKSAAGRKTACPTFLLLSNHDTVVDNKATLKALPNAEVRWSSDPTASHALTNAACWRSDLEEMV